MMKQRVSTMDGLRGFSLLGILIANMLIFQYGMFGKDQIENFQLSTGDTVAYVWTKIFVESSFLPIFMFLFGYALIKLKENLERNNRKVKRHFVRRFILLILFGTLHAIFIWEGDILLAYGLVGLLMFIFINRKKKTMLIWALVLFALTSLMAFGGDYEKTEKEVQTMESYIQKESNAYTEGNYVEAFEFRNSEEDPFGYPDYFYLVLLLMAPLVISPLFLFGMYAAKSKWFTHPNKEKKMYIRNAVIFGSIGILLKSTPYVIIDQNWTEGAYTIGSSFLSIGYIFGFALLYTKASGKLLSYFEQVGRLSMTNYLMQSVICTTIFYGYGLGYFGRLGVFPAIVLSITIFVIQIIASHFYLKIFKAGPFEKLMRIGTYLSWSGRLKMKKSKEERVA